MTDVVREAILDYVRSKAERAEFRAALQRAMEENTQLIADLRHLGEAPDTHD